MWLILCAASAIPPLVVLGLVVGVVVVVASSILPFYIPHINVFAATNFSHYIWISLGAFLYNFGEDIESIRIRNSL